MLSSKEFAKRAGFPKRWRERHLQEYVIAQLKQRGYAVEDEVPVLGGRFRADIVTNWASAKTIIEMKKVVSSDDIYKATRQLQIYAKHLQGDRKVIMGLLPETSAAQRSVLNNAEQSQADGIEVVFLNLEPQWFPEEQRRWRGLCVAFFSKFGSWSDFKFQVSKSVRGKIMRHKRTTIAIAVVLGLLYGFWGGHLLHQIVAFFFALL